VSGVRAVYVYEGDEERGQDNTVCSGRLQRHRVCCLSDSAYNQSINQLINAKVTKRKTRKTFELIEQNRAVTLLENTPHETRKTGLEVFKVKKV